MFKKTLTAIAIAGALIFTGSSAALADEDYPVDVNLVASPVTIPVGSTSALTAT